MWTDRRWHTTDFTRDFQQMITRYAWGTVWARPGLDSRTRRLLVVADHRRTGAVAKSF